MEEIIWEHWKPTALNYIEAWACVLDKGEFSITKKVQGWHIEFWQVGSVYAFVELGYYTNPDSAKIAAETYYLHRLRNGTL